MGKIVKIRFNSGDFEHGFKVTLDIGKDIYPYSYPTETQIELPCSPEIPQFYDNWVSKYNKWENCLRGTHAPPQAINTAELKTDCQEARDTLEKCVKKWFEDAISSFVIMWTKLNPKDEVRILIQTNDLYLRKLPWQEWGLFADIYTDSEFALCPAGHDEPKTASVSRNPQVKILAILGNAQNIDVNKDRKRLEESPNADLLFLDEPLPKDVLDNLWTQNWDILFFAGHSTSQNETGRIYINPTDFLTVKDLKSGLRHAIENGLQLAFFNSCDGLKLAEDLAGLNIPQVIVMREPVPDRAAHAFLEYFLHAFSGGRSLYLSVRLARERLHGNYDAQYPGCGWLPIICQNPATEPLSWRKLTDSEAK
ncbi:CHAT domain-containing protein [Desulfococcaceae bacterium HSG7]|nr:CHAT domain-containing protein [Desulfococcaceae bacterium HSG7]